MICSEMYGLGLRFRKGGWGAICTVDDRWNQRNNKFYQYSVLRVQKGNINV